MGVHGGYSFGENEDNFLEFSNDDDRVFDDTVLVAAADAFPDDQAFSDFEGGAHFGGQIGYDWQLGNFLIGAVGDISFVDVEDIVNGDSTSPGTPNYTFTRELSFLATGRLRGGVTFDRFLAYVTGGVAYGNFDFEFDTASAAVLGNVTDPDEDAWGYTVGGGVEAMLTQRVSFGVEYLYTDLDVDRQEARFVSGPFVVAPGTGTDIRAEDDEFNFHTVRGTVKFRF